MKRWIATACLLACLGPMTGVLAKSPVRAIPAEPAGIAHDGADVRVADVPGLFQTRFHYAPDGRFLYSVTIEAKTGRVLGTVQARNDRASPGPLPANMGPPANFTGIWELGEFPGGGRLYGEYQGGHRTATIIVQPDGTIVYIMIQ